MDIPKLQSQVFLREDLEAILHAIVVANADIGNSSPHDAARRKGFAQAIVAMTVAIHVDPPPMIMQIIAPSNQRVHADGCASPAIGAIEGR